VEGQEELLPQLYQTLHQMHHMFTQLVAEVQQNQAIRILDKMAIMEQEAHLQV
jgi:hypothetical protein